MNALTYLLINQFWYHVRIYMNFPDGWIKSHEPISSSLARASDIDLVLDKLDDILKEHGIKERFKRSPELTLGELLNQIHNFKI